MKNTMPKLKKAFHIPTNSECFVTNESKEYHVVFPDGKREWVKFCEISFAKRNNEMKDKINGFKNKKQ